VITDLRKTPWPWFGGKAPAAEAVWAALGDVPHYVEPFAGSLAVLLRRPHEANRTYYSETVNDLDGLLVNAWRSMQWHPDETAEAASWPVSEADLHARHVSILRWREERELERLMGDPAFCDPVIAGWWMWGQSCWIGSGWCSGKGPWTVDESGRLVKRGKGQVSRQLPHLTNDGRGVNHAGTREPGTGDPDFHPMTMPELRRWFAYLSARLRHVRILNGDWTRAVTSGAAKSLPVRQGQGPAGVFLDPPYADTAKRKDDLYASDSLTVAHDVREWCLTHGDDPDYRIVLAGYEGEHGDAFERAGWREVEWFAAGFLTGGMGNVGGKHQQGRERLWLSPHCVAAKKAAQCSLFATEVA
jgi:DNA adenine methylase